MPNTTEDKVLRTLRERAANGEINGIDVTYKVTGGAPGEQLVNEEVHLSGSDLVQARTLQESVMREASVDIGAAELRTVLLEIGEGLGELIPQSEARFVPDTIVGQISVKVDGQEVSFFFLPDEEQARQHRRSLSMKAARSVGSLQRLGKEILQRGGAP
ncbi:MAG: hypothetical protein CV088_20275 [Nitrospira sp. LK70]|nr:hypothetical protein [Nitrospira sp. LK70]